MADESGSRTHICRSWFSSLLAISRVPSSAKVTPRRHPRRGFSHALQTRSNTHEKTSLDLANYVKSMPSAFRVRPGSIPLGAIVESGMA